MADGCSKPYPPYGTYVPIRKFLSFPFLSAFTQEALGLAIDPIIRILSTYTNS